MVYVHLMNRWWKAWENVNKNNLEILVSNQKMINEMKVTKECKKMIRVLLESKINGGYWIKVINKRVAIRCWPKYKIWTRQNSEGNERSITLKGYYWVLYLGRDEGNRNLYLSRKWYGLWSWDSWIITYIKKGHNKLLNILTMDQSKKSFSYWTTKKKGKTKRKGKKLEKTSNLIETA